MFVSKARPIGKWAACVSVTNCNSSNAAAAPQEALTNPVLHCIQEGLVTNINDCRPIETSRAFVRLSRVCVHSRLKYSRKFVLVSASRVANRELTPPAIPVADVRRGGNAKSPPTLTLQG